MAGDVIEEKEKEIREDMAKKHGMKVWQITYIDDSYVIGRYVRGEPNAIVMHDILQVRYHPQKGTIIAAPAHLVGEVSVYLTNIVKWAGEVDETGKKKYEEQMVEVRLKKLGIDKGTPADLDRIKKEKHLIS